jgi:hypothetical protein
MTSLGLSEKGQTFRYELLSIKIFQVLLNCGKDIVLGKKEQEIMERGEALIKKIVEGAILVEGKKVDSFSPTQEGLSVYGYALSTIEALSMANKIEEFTEFFVDILSQLKSVRCGEKVEPEKLTFLKDFFWALGKAFRGDIVKEKYTQSNEEFIIRQHFSHAPSFA